VEGTNMCIKNYRIYRTIILLEWCCKWVR